jgi:hypothetical protein
MTNRVLLKRSSVANSVPASGNLEYGELALNYTDGNLFFKTASNAVTLIASTQTANFTGNVTAANFITAGNVSANYFLGNGALLTGVITSVANINNGTSNVTVVSSGGNVTVGVGGTGNVAVFSTNGLDITGRISATGNITAANLITDGNVNAGNLNTSGRASITGNVAAGNLLTNGEISATGNITAGNIISLNQIDAEYLVIKHNANIGNIVANTAGFTTIAGNLTTGYQPNITSVGTLEFLNVSGNASAGNINSLGAISGNTATLSGNVTANYFIGNGSQLTGISTTTSEIFNGNSNVSIDSAGANVTMDVNGEANVVVISPGSIFVNGIFASPKTLTSNVQMAANSSAMVISPLTIANGYSMSIPTSSTVYVFTPS